MRMVRGSRVTISCGLKVKFCVEKWFHGVFAWSDYSAEKCTIRITDEMDMTPLQVSCWRGKFLRRTQSGPPSTIIYVHNKAMGVTNLGVMLLWVKQIYAPQASIQVNSTVSTTCGFWNVCAILNAYILTLRYVTNYFPILCRRSH